MNKKNKKVARYLERKYKKNLKNSRGKSVDISQFPEYSDLKGQNVIVKINQNGKIESMSRMSPEEIAAQEEKEILIKQAKKEQQDIIKGRKKKRDKLAAVKEDPEPINKDYDKLIDNYMTAKKKADEEKDEKAKNVFEKRAARIGRNLIDKSITLSNITGGEEWRDAINVTGQKPASIEQGERYISKKDPKRATDVLESLDDPKKTLKVLQKPTDLQQLSDEELIKRLKL